MYPFTSIHLYRPWHERIQQKNNSKKEKLLRFNYDLALLWQFHSVGLQSALLYINLLTLSDL